MCKVVNCDAVEPDDASMQDHKLINASFLEYMYNIYRQFYNKVYGLHKSLVYVDREILHSRST